jgi:hypothetical protein
MQIRVRAKKLYSRKEGGHTTGLGPFTAVGASGGVEVQVLEVLEVQCSACSAVRRLGASEGSEGTARRGIRGQRSSLLRLRLSVCDDSEFLFLDSARASALLGSLRHCVPARIASVCGAALLWARKCDPCATASVQRWKASAHSASSCPE